MLSHSPATEAAVGPPARGAPATAAAAVLRAAARRRRKVEMRMHFMLFCGVYAGADNVGRP